MSGPAVRAVIYDRTNTTPVTDGALVIEAPAEPFSHWALTDAKAMRRINEPGDGSAEVLLRHPNVDRIDYRRVCRLIEQQLVDGEPVDRVIRSFMINKIDDGVHVPSSELRRSFSGDDMLARLGEMLRMGPTSITAPLQADKRRYDWGAGELDTSGWSTVTVYEQPRDDLLFGSVRPVAWPTPVADEPLGIPWLHWRPPYTTHPSEIGYWDNMFTLDADSEVILFATASDELEVCLDSVELLAEKLQGPNSVWWYTFKCGAKLEAGVHTVRVKVNVVNPTGAGGFIFCGFKTGPAGIGDIILATGTNTDPGAVDGGWRVLVGDPPGMSAGQIMRIGQQEAAIRGVEVPARSFDDDLDSRGDAWPIIVGFSHPVPTTELDVLKALAPWCEFRVRDDSYTLDLFRDGIGGTTDVDLEPGTEIMYLARHGVA